MTSEAQQHTPLIATGLVVIDQNGRVESFNPAAERIFGYSAPEVIGRNVSMLMPEPFSREHDQYLRNYLETGRGKIVGFSREVPARRKDGSIFPMELAVRIQSMSSEDANVNALLRLDAFAKIMKDCIETGFEELDPLFMASFRRAP